MVHGFHEYTAHSRSVSAASARAARRLALAAIALLAGCAIVDNDAPDTGAVEVRATGSSIVMSNDLNQRIYYFMVGRNLSVLIDWVPQLVEEQSVSPGRSVSVPYEDIMMDPAGETQVGVSWWTAVVRDGKGVPGDMMFVVVDL